jgi:hypothetical protein
MKGKRRRHVYTRLDGGSRRINALGQFREITTLKVREPLFENSRLAAHICNNGNPGEVAKTRRGEPPHTNAAATTRLLCAEPLILSTVYSEQNGP